MKFLVLFLAFIISSSFALTPFRCNKAEDIHLLRNQKVNIPFKCSQQIGTIEITPKLPKGLELVKDRIVGMLKERCETHLYKIHFTSAQTTDSYDDEFTLGSITHLREFPRGAKHTKAIRNYITTGSYWYIYSNATGTADKDWIDPSFNPAVSPYEWIYTPANNLPTNIGQKYVFYKTSFTYTNDVIDNMKQMLGIISVDGAFGIIINGHRIFSKGISLDDFGDFNKTAYRNVSVEDYELYMPLELFIYGENTIEIAVHAYEGEEDKEKRFSFTLSAWSSTDEPVVQTLSSVGSGGMTIIADKTAKTANPRYSGLVDGVCGEQNKLSLGGYPGDESSIFPNKITCSFPNHAKYFNSIMLGTINNNNVFPKTFSLEGTVEMIGEKGVDSVWEKIGTTITAESTANYKSNYMYHWDMNNPNFHLYEGYRLKVESNFNYNIAFGNYLEIGEFVVKYKSMSDCIEDGYSSTFVGSYGTKFCPEDQYGYIKKECTADGFSNEEINECKPKQISNLVYPNDGITKFYVNYNNTFVPTYEGLAKSFSIDCGENHTEFKIDRFGVIRGSPPYAYDNLSCTVSYIGDGGDEGEVTVTISSQNFYCEEENYAITIAGEYLEIDDCKTVNELYANTGKYYCTPTFPPKLVAVDRCKYDKPILEYPEYEYEFVKDTEITPIEPSNIELRHTRIYFSSGTPLGFRIDPETGVITGTTESLKKTYTTVITIENEDASNTTTLKISIVNKLTTSIVYSNMELITGVPFKSSRPQIDEESVIGSCSIEPPLPEGLTLSCKTGIISGTNTDQLDGYEAQHTVSNTATSATFNLKIIAKYCAEDGGFAVTFPGKTGTKPCSTLGEEGKEYGDITRVCKITDKTTYDVEWEDPSNSGCHEAYPRSFTVDESTLIGVTKAAKAVKLIVDPPSNYKITLDPPPPSSTIAAGNTIMFPSGSSYMETASVTVVGDVNLTMTYDFKIYAPVCEGDGFPRTQVGGTATKKCALPKYGTVIGTCKESDPPPYKFTEDDSGCHDAYPTNVEWNIPDKLYVAFALEIRPVVSNPPDTISFEWKDNKSPGGLRLDGKTGVIIGVPTEDTQNSPEFTVIVHGDTDTEYKLVINVIQLRCEATDTYPEVNAGEIAQGKCQQGEEGFKSAKCIITSSGGNYIAEFTPLDSHCEAARPSFTYTPQEKGYRLGKDEINLIPEYDANIFPLLTWTFENLPDGVSGNPTDGSIKGIPTSTNPIDNIQIIGITASTGNKESDPFPLMVYIADDYRCVAKGIYPTSVKGSKFDSPCLDGKIGNQRIECLSGGIWSDLLTTNCTNPIIHNEENNLTVVFKFTAKNVTIDDLLMEDIEGLRQGICAVLGIKDNCKNRVQVVAVKSNGRRRILVDESVEFNAYIVTDKETVTQARVEENLPNFQAKKTFSDKYKATLGNRLTSSKLSSVLNEIEAPIQQVVVPKPPEAKKEGLDDTTMYIIIGVAAAVGVLIILVVCCLICYCRRVKSSHGGASKAPVKKRGTKV